MSYAELHAHSAFSFLDGASSPDELAIRAAELGYEAMALTDHDGLWGSMEFAKACESQGVRPITGAEVTVLAPGSPPPPHSPARRESCPPGAFHVTLLVEDAAGYSNLCRLLTAAHSGTRERPQEPVQPTVTLGELVRHSEGLVCLSGCARDGALAGRIARGEHDLAARLGRRLAGAFGPDHFRVELQRPFWRGDRVRNRRLAELAETLGVPCVATGNVHAHDRRRVALQDALVTVRLGGTLESTEPDRRGNGISAMVDPRRQATRFAEHPEAVAETVRLAERLRFDLNRDLGYAYPGSEDGSADRRLAEACRARFGERFDTSPHRAEAERRLTEELRVIGKLGLSGFFLLHRDLLELARDVAFEVRGPDSARALLPPGRGRGSSVSSIVCYLTGLSHVDPIEAGLFLGRFLNDEITEAPDIDLDFPRDVRERLIPRIHERYGPERSALVAAFPTYRAKGAVRDFGKALGLPPGEIERVARSISPYVSYEPDTRTGREAEDARSSRDGGSDPIDPENGINAEISEAIGPQRASSARWVALARLMEEAYGLPRHPSQHPGGMVLSTRPLTELCPVVPAAMEGRQIAQWDKDSCADAGFLKIDLLGLGMLSAVERAVTEIGRVRGERIDLSRVPLDDEEVFRRIRAAETTGVFQIESRAQMQMLPRSRPENIEDLTVQVALVRPGPIQGGAVHPYLERKRALREDPGYVVPYEHPSLEPILADTLGAIVFQDQVIQVAMALAGFSAGEAEGLRRAMSRKRSDAALRGYRGRFVEGAVAEGVEREVAERVFDQIKGFSGFGFPKSHAAAFGLLAYQSTWLRVHYGPEFLCALLNEQPMGFYPPDALVHEAQRRGIEVRAVEVNESAVECRVEPDASPPTPASERDAADPGLSVRIGLGFVKGLAAADAEAVVSERDLHGPYADLADLASRSGVSRDGLERLAWSGACAAIGTEPGEAGRPGEAGDPRRVPLWRLGVARGSQRTRDGEQLALPLPVPPAPALAEQTPWERITADYAASGISLAQHPLELLRPDLREGTVTCADLERIADGSSLHVAGLLVARQRPATARGVMFLLIEDETGVANVIVLPPVYERHRLVVRTAPLITIAGRLERREGVINVVAAGVERLERPDAPLAEVRSIEPDARRETGTIHADLDAVLPAAHSFGRRGH
ncbi:MAG: error-prone DNA polymerase [Thermoleophilales bacterium]|nr:error-prone DNA polymerase [Thermoleophilales bacterium]